MTQAKQNICLAEEENGHKEMYLTWVHQGDGINFYKCEMCGWVKLETKTFWQKLKDLFKKG